MQSPPSAIASNTLYSWVAKGFDARPQLILIIAVVYGLVGLMAWMPVKRISNGIFGVYLLDWCRLQRLIVLALKYQLLLLC